MSTGPGAEAQVVAEAQAGAPGTVLIAGASGMIGTEVVRQLEESGVEVHTLVRRAPRTAREHNWAPSAGMLDEGLLDRMDAVISLSGASLGKLPWTAEYKKQILQSRLDSTRTLTDAMNRAASPPSVFLSGSAVGIYGDRPAERLDDNAARGAGFLADVVEAWEDAARMAPEQTRVVLVRTGIVVGDGGAMTPLLRLTAAGIGSRLGTGGQHWAWVSLHDEAAAIRHLLTSTLSGSVNVVGPTPATSDRLTAALAKRMRRPYLFAVPERVITLMLGDAGHDMLLTSQKVLPTKLLGDGFRFRHEQVEDALDALIDERQHRND